jgi:hypothetical protein
MRQNATKADKRRQKATKADKKYNRKMTEEPSKTQ